MQRFFFFNVCLMSSDPISSSLPMYAHSAHFYFFRDAQSQCLHTGTVQLFGVYFGSIFFSGKAYEKANVVFSFPPVNRRGST